MEATCLLTETRLPSSSTTALAILGQGQGVPTPSVRGIRSRASRRPGLLGSILNQSCPCSDATALDPARGAAPSPVRSRQRRASSRTLDRSRASSLARHGRLRFRSLDRTTRTSAIRSRLGRRGIRTRLATSDERECASASSCAAPPTPSWSEAFDTSRGNGRGESQAHNESAHPGRTAFHTGRSAPGRVAVIVRQPKSERAIALILAPICDDAHARSKAWATWPGLIERASERADPLRSRVRGSRPRRERACDESPATRRCFLDMEKA